MPPKGKELYFIALIPPAPVYQETLDLKKEMAEKYDSKAALKSPPHITLHMPFGMKPSKEEAFINHLQEVLQDAYSFNLTLEGYGAFPPRVIYIHVVNTPPLQTLYERIKKFMKNELQVDNADYKNRGYTPHLTLAFRDLKKASFNEAWEEFQDKEYKAGWDVNTVTLLKHNGKEWDPLHEMTISKAM
jgi:2'-5' RNA ligase